MKRVTVTDHEFEILRVLRMIDRRKDMHITWEVGDHCMAMSLISWGKEHKFYASKIPAMEMVKRAVLFIRENDTTDHRLDEMSEIHRKARKHMEYERNKLRLKLRRNGQPDNAA